MSATLYFVPRCASLVIGYFFGCFLTGALVVRLKTGKSAAQFGTGNPGMATAGSGDVLTGLLLSLMAQKYNPVESALLSVFIHGLAGDLYAESHDPRTLIASDLPLYFSSAYQKLNLHLPTKSDNF